MKHLLKIGICADVHQEFTWDACERLSAFVAEMNRENADFIIQLGDFCEPHKRNKPFMDVWNSFKGRKFHVIGNHDHDRRKDDYKFIHNYYSPDEIAAYWNMPAHYYSFNLSNWHFVILYCHEQKPDCSEKEAYPLYISKEQLSWLIDDLNNTDLPVMVFSHPGADVSNGVREGYFLRRILELANEKAGWEKVRFYFSGHHHRDYYNVINNIHYFQINSMTHFWLGYDFPLKRNSPEMHEKYPYLEFMSLYKEPLWALMTINSDGSMKIKGKKTEFTGPSPQEMGFDFWRNPYPSVPYVSDREIPGIKHG